MLDKIVGIIERPSMTIEGESAPGDTVITKMEEVEENANIAVLYKKVSKYQEYTEQINEMVKGLQEIPEEYKPLLKIINKKPILPSDIKAL